MRLFLIDVGAASPLVICVQADEQADLCNTAVIRVQPLLDSLTIGP